MGEAVDSVALQPATGRARTVKLVGANNGGAELADGAVRGSGDKFSVLVHTAIVHQFQQAGLVATGHVQLQRLGQIGHLALFFRQSHCQAQVMAGQLIADEADTGPDQFKQLKPLWRRDEQLVELDDGVIELPGNLADIGHWQAAEPVTEGFRGRLTERQAGNFLIGNSQVWLQVHTAHTAHVVGCAVASVALPAALAPAVACYRESA